RETNALILPARVDPSRIAVHRLQRIDLDRHHGIEGGIQLEGAVASRVADDARALLDVVAGIVRVTVDPHRDWWAHQVREIAGEARIEWRALVLAVNAARMRQVMS